MIQNVAVHDEHAGKILVSGKDIDRRSRRNQQSVFPNQLGTAGRTLPRELEWIDVDVEDVRGGWDAAARDILWIANGGDRPLLRRTQLQSALVLWIVGLVVDLKIN